MKLGVLQLWQKEADQGDYIIETSTFELYSSRVSLENLAGASIPRQAASDKPQIVLGSSSNESSSTNATSGDKPIDIHVVYWKTDLFNCPKLRKQDSPPQISISLNEKDSIAASTEVPDMELEVKHPVIAGKTYNTCSEGCTSSTTTDSAGIPRFQCSCESIASMRPSAQLVSLIKDSNVYKIAKFAALKSYKLLSSWAFWFLLILLMAYAISLSCITFKAVNPLKFKNDFIGYGLTRKWPSDLKDLRISLSFWRILWLAFKVTLPLTLGLTSSVWAHNNICICTKTISFRGASELHCSTAEFSRLQHSQHYSFRCLSLLR